ncbi:MAG: hypothetical protein K2J20_01790, partial [Bacilli bacterium]|nr:hypothetical protein [Bacilli bacterium]
MTYKKLFNIQYNNKTFTIFIDENNRRTFLEIDEKGEYAYPDFEDFKALNEIYNNRNPFICYNVPKFTFKEKVRMTSMILAAIVASGCAIEAVNNRGLTVNDVDSVVEVGISKFTNTYIEIKDLSELDDILGYKTISKEEIEMAIDNNDNLTPDLKSLAHQELDAILNEYPDADLRIFYENIKSLNVYMFETIEDLQKAQKLDGVAGSYSAVHNTIYLYKGTSDEVKAHEIKHTFHSFYRKVGDKVVVRSEEKGHSLNEAMTNKLTGMIIDTHTYENAGAILDYFLICDDYDFYDYNNKGIWYLIDKLSKKYPDVDIDYIVNCLDSLTDTLLKTGEYKYLDESPDLLNELFLLATKQIDLTHADVYEPFYNYMELFECVQNQDLLFEYLTKYN